MFLALFTEVLLKTAHNLFICPLVNIYVGEIVETPQNQNPKPKLDPVKALYFLDQFLERDLEEVINKTMVIADSRIHVIMVQAPCYCPHGEDDDIVYTQGIVEIGGKHYPIKIMADFSGETIRIRSEVFAVEVFYDFVNGKLLDFNTDPEPVKAKGYFGDER